MDLTPKAEGTKARINKRDRVKLKRFCTTVETISKMKGDIVNGRKYLPIILMKMGFNIQNI